jgi:hypothetical protein
MATTTQNAHLFPLPSISVAMVSSQRTEVIVICINRVMNFRTSNAVIICMETALFMAHVFVIVNTTIGTALCVY